MVLRLDLRNGPTDDKAISMVFEEGIKATTLIVIVLLGGLLYPLIVVIACAAAVIKNIVKGKAPLEGVWISNAAKTPEPIRMAFAETND